MVLNEEARVDVDVGVGPGRKASGAGWEAQPAIGLEGAHCQNVIEMGPKFVLKKQLSKIKDEPVILMKINKLKNDKMPDAIMLLNQQGLSLICGKPIKMCQMDKI